jgi:hypothetical protein
VPEESRGIAEDSGKKTEENRNENQGGKQEDEWIVVSG